MEELYRRVSDNQTMGSVVGELRSTLGEAERAMDQFFRNPEDVSPLTSVPGRLAQMRGVLSVLGLDQASLAVLRMRETVERLLLNEVGSEEERKQTFEKLGNSLGALGFLIDMLSYQRAMARKLFVYDEELGELRILMGRTRARAGDQADSLEELEQKMEERAAVPLPDVIPRDSLYAQTPVEPAPAPSLGVPVDTVSWGSMLNEAQNELILGYWWQLVAATAFMAVLVTAFSLFTDALRDALDPKLK